MRLCGLPGQLGDPRPPPPQVLQYAQEGADHLRIELHPSAAPQFGEAATVAQGWSIGPLTGHGVVTVDHAHGAGKQRDRLAGQAVGVALAVEALVVVAHALNELCVKQRTHDLGADAGMLTNELPLLRGQGAGLEQHAVRYADLADVVQEGDVLDLFQTLGGPAQLAAQQGHVGRDPVGVAEGVVVLGGQGGAQGSQVAQVEVLDLLVELGVLERQGDELGDRFGGGDLVRCELALNVVEQVDDADDLVAGHQGQHKGAALAVAAHLLALCLAEPRVVAAGQADHATRLQGEPVAGPVVETQLAPGPGLVEHAVEGGGQADQAPISLEPVDVAVGDLQGRA